MTTEQKSSAGVGLRLLIIPVLMTATILVAWKLGYFDLDRRAHLYDAVQRLRVTPWIESIYVPAYALLIMMGLPAVIGTIVSGAIFGHWIGAVLAYLGMLVGTMLSHSLARSVAAQPLRRLFGDHRLMRELREQTDMLSLIRLRLIPIGPLAVLGYVAGIASVSLRKLITATAIGMIPSVVAYSFVGAKLMESIAATDGEPRRALTMASIVTIAMIILPSVVHRLRPRPRRDG